MVYTEKNEIEIGKEYLYNPIFKSRFGKLNKSGNVILLDVMPVAQPHPYGKYAVMVKYLNERLDNHMWIGINELS